MRHDLTIKKRKTMKIIEFVFLACWPAAWLSAQVQPLPDVALRNIDGQIVSSKDIIRAETPTLLVFWKSTSGKCCENVEILQEAWEETLKDYKVRMVAVCVDCNGSWSHVKPIVNGKSWDFDTYIDVNGDFKRAMCVGEAPCTMLFDRDQKIVCRYNSGCTGTHDFICQNILEHLKIPVKSEK